MPSPTSSPPAPAVTPWSSPTPSAAPPAASPSSPSTPPSHPSTPTTSTSTPPPTGASTSPPPATPASPSPTTTPATASPPPPTASGGTTKGLKLEANYTGAGVAALSISPIGQSFGANYRLHFDMWINANGAFPLGGTGSSQLLTAGVGTDGTRVQWNSGTSDGVFFAIDGEGQATDTSPDIRAQVGHHPPDQHLRRLYRRHQHSPSAAAAIPTTPTSSPAARPRPPPRPKPARSTSAPWASPGTTSSSTSPATSSSGSLTA